MTKKKRDKPQITNIRTERGDIAIELTGKNNVREYYEQLYLNILDQSDEMNIFPEQLLLLKLTQEETENPNGHLKIKDF